MIDNGNSSLYKIIFKSKQYRHSRENGWYYNYIYIDENNIQYSKNIYKDMKIKKYVYE